MGGHFNNPSCMRSHSLKPLALPCQSVKVASLFLLLAAACNVAVRPALCVEEPASNNLKPPIVPDAAQPQTLRLQQAIELALLNNPDIRNAELELGISRDRVENARSHQFPAMHLTGGGIQLLTPLNFKFSKGSLGTDPDTGPIPDENVNLTSGQHPFLVLNASIVQPLIQLGRVRVGVKQAELSTIAAQQKLQIQRQQITSQVKKTYYKALDLQDSLQVIEASRKLYREIARTTGEYLKVRAVLPGDSLEVTEALARLELNALQARNALSSAMERINYLVGRDPRRNFALVADLEATPSGLDLETAQKQALRGRVEIQQNASQRKTMELGARSKKLEYLPDLNLCVDYLSVFGAENFLPKNVVFLGLIGNWECYDWGRKRAELSEQRKQLRQVNNNLQQLRSEILLEVNNACRRYDEAQMQLQVARLSQQTTQEKLRVIANRYQQKASLLRDVLQAERDQTQANSQYLQSVLALWTARADLEAAIGTE